MSASGLALPATVVVVTAHQRVVTSITTAAAHLVGTALVATTTVAALLLRVAGTTTIRVRNGTALLVVARRPPMTIPHHVLATPRSATEDLHHPQRLEPIATPSPTSTVTDVNPTDVPRAPEGKAGATIAVVMRRDLIGESSPPFSLPVLQPALPACPCCVERALNLREDDQQPFRLVHTAYQTPSQCNRATLPGQIFSGLRA